MSDRPHRRVGRLAAVAAFLLLLLTPIVPADEGADPAAEEPGEAAAEVPVIPDDEARKLAADLGKVATKRKASEVLPTLEAIGERSHPALHKSLVKLLTHPVEKVAIRASDILAVQRLEKEKDRAKLAKSVWKSGFAHAKNQHRYNLKGRTVLVVTTLTGEPIDKRQFRDVEKMWRFVIETRSDKGYAPCIVDVCRSVKQTKDKRYARMLAEQIERPEPADINSPTNPPGSYWEKRYHLWVEISAEAVEALELLTGKSFKTLDDAKQWIREHRKEGFDW